MRGECIHFFHVLFTRLPFDMLHKFITAAMFLVVRMHGKTDKFTGFFFFETEQCGTGNDHAVTFDDREIMDIELKLLARTFNQGALLFQRRDEFKYAANVINCCCAQSFIIIGGDQCADAITGVELE